MDARFRGKVALVTGAGSGIGRATALAFAGEGARVVVADVNVEGGEETVRQVRGGGGEALFVCTDVSGAPDVEAMVKSCVEAYGRLDCAFNNAGVSGWAPTHELAEDIWDRTIATNLKGVWLCMKYEIRQMLAQGAGAIVNTSSVWGFTGSPNGAAYVASKHGIIGLTRTAALEYAQQGIRVNAVCPGIVRTPMLDARLRSVGEDRLKARYPMNRIAEPEEIAGAVLWLCSDAASFITGHAMSVDGGFVAQ